MAKQNLLHDGFSGISRVGAEEDSFGDVKPSLRKIDNNASSSVVGKSSPSLKAEEYEGEPMPKSGKKYKQD